MSQQKIETISEFLLHGNANYIIFDMGRELNLVDSQEFLDIENGILPAPKPRQQHAWYGIVFWHGNAKQQHYIWFLKLPLDEQGLLVQASRNHFLQIIIDALGASVIEGAEKQDTLPDNPYTFVPSQSQMAQFSASVKRQLTLNSHESVDAAMHYFKAPMVVDWRQLSVQNMADCAIACNDQSIADIVFKGQTQWPSDVAVPFLNACESVALSSDVQTQLLSALNQCDNKHEPYPMALLRALATHQKTQSLHAYLSERLRGDSGLTLDELSVIAGRHYTQFDGALILAFFENVALTDEQHQYNWALFKGFFSDLGQIPDLREEVLGLLRNTNRSERLSRAIGSLFAQGPTS